VVFVDGLHLFEQAYRDVLGGLRGLRHGGLVIIDDTVPTDEYTSRRDPTATREGLSSAWFGDVYKVVFLLSKFHPEVDFRTITGEHCQTLVWLLDDFVPPQPSEIQFRCKSIEGLTFERTFAQGVPPPSFVHLMKIRPSTLG